jgi:arginyl-tRNA synthetase
MITTLEQLLRTAITGMGYEYPAGVVISEPPAHIPGDYAANAALLLAKLAGQNPRELAAKLAEALQASEVIERVSIEGPGFLNISISNTLYLQALQQGFSIEATTQPKKVCVEYISANPTGPLHIGNARGGPFGETVSRALEALGHSVHRDFYVNDVGGQANTFAASVLHYYKQRFNVPSEFPEKGYPAPYVQELANEIADGIADAILKLPESEQREAMRKEAISRQVEKIKATADRMGISFDSWSPQSDLLSSGRSARALATLHESDTTMQKEGATWLKAGLAEDDRETVLVKSDGTTTYFLDDIAFYRMKLEEWGMDYGVCVLGANHFGHIPRMRAGLAGLGLDGGRYQAAIYQNVQLKEGGVAKKMAKREGTFVTADEVLDEIPLDVFNWFMVSKAPETHLDFDLSLAKDTSEKNPVYYVQYAHARICNILARIEEAATLPEAAEFNPEERALIRHLAAFSAVVREVALEYRVNALPNYLHELATRYHHFYAHHRVIEEGKPHATRVAISQATAAILKEGLRLINSTAPAQMGR